MFTDYDVKQIARWIDDQTRLAALAGSEDVRAMHLELAALYRSQIALVVTADCLRLDDVVPPRFALAA